MIDPEKLRVKTVRVTSSLLLRLLQAESNLPADATMVRVFDDTDLYLRLHTERPDVAEIMVMIRSASFESIPADKNSILPEFQLIFNGMSMCDHYRGEDEELHRFYDRCMGCELCHGWGAQHALGMLKRGETL